MENSENNYQATNSIEITEQIKSYLLEMSKWAKFLSILGFVGLGLMLVVSLIMIVAGSAFGSFGTGSAVGAGMVSIVYMLMAVLYFFPIYYLFRSSTGIKNGINSNDQNSLTTGFENLKSHYKFIGILMIVVLSMYILGILFAVLMFAMR